MNLPPCWVDFLTGAGFTAVHWSDEGPLNATDRDLAAWIAERGYVLVTADIDPSAFGAGPLILVVNAEDLSPEAAGGSVLETIHGLGSDRPTASGTVARHAP
jgi:predicted nuclease of predicted toxin-antitoxin system